MSSATENLREFFDYIWGDNEGLVYVPTLDKDEIDQKMYKWPKQRDTVITHILKASAEGKDAFFSPAIYEKGPPRKENIKGTQFVWADFDEAVPESFGNVPEPTLRIQSSIKEKQHFYWKLEEFETDIRKIEDVNRSIAYHFGADTSGWDATQFLRPPDTINMGYRKNREPMKVQRISGFGGPVKFEQFNLPSPKAVVNERIDLESIPPIQEVIALNSWTPDMWELFSKPVAEVTDRSAALQRLAYSGAEIGLSDEAIYSVLLQADSRWRKYADRHDQKLRLIDCINKARSKIGYNFDDDSVIDALVSSVKEPVAVKQSDKIILPFGEFLEEKYEFEWLLDGLLTTRGLGLVSGVSGTGKTQLIMQMASNLATGQDFFNWKIKTSPKKVLFLSLEMDGPPLQLFAKKTAKAYTERELALMNKNLSVAPLGTPIPFDTEAGQELVDNILTATRPEVVLIDSLSQTISSPTTDEVAAKKLMWFVNKHIRQKHGAAVVFIHHNRKESSLGFGESPSLDDVYGNTFLTNQLDFGLTLRKTHEEDRLNLYHVKARLSRVEAPLSLRRTKHLTYERVDGNEPTGAGPIKFGPDSSKDTGEGFGLNVAG